MVGQFKNDNVGNHAHNYKIGQTVVVAAGSSYGVNDWAYDNTYTTGSLGTETVNRGKRKGVKYIIKVL